MMVDGKDERLKVPVRKRGKKDKRKKREAKLLGARTERFQPAAVPFASLSRINWKSSISPRLEPPRSTGPPQLSLWFKVAIDQRTFPRGGLRKPETSSLRRGIRFPSASCWSAFFRLVSRPLEKFPPTRTINPSCTVACWFPSEKNSAFASRRQSVYLGTMSDAHRFLTTNTIKLRE